MLFDRLRNEDDQTILYHYCSPDTFLEIIRIKTVRFSDLNLLNDEEEGRYGYGIFIEAANRMLEAEKPNLIEDFDVEFVDLVDGAWHNIGYRLSSFLTCFSTDGDSLGQWRAYPRPRLRRS